MQNKNASKKIAVVTGAAGNLGEAVVKKFVDKDFYVEATINKSRLEINLPAESFEQTAVNLNNENEAKNFVDSIISKHKKIDIAVLTAGGFAMGKISDTKTEDIHRQLQLNFETAYNIARPIFLQMLEQNSGRIFLVGSKAGWHSKNSKGMIAYGLSKSLVFRLAEMMNDEAGDKSVKTIVIVPSTIDTPENRKAMPGEDFSKWTKPETIAALIYDTYINEVNEMIFEV